RLRGIFLSPSDGHQSCFGLHECIVCLRVFVRTVCSVSGNRGMDESGVGRTQFLCSKAEPFSGSGGEVLDEDIGRGDELVENLQPLGLLEVEGKALLVAIDPHKVARQPIDRGVIAAGEVAAPRAFDLDDSGAEVSQLSRGERSCDGLFATDYGDSGQRQALADDSRYGRLGGRGHRPSTMSCHSRTRTSYISLLIMHYRITQCEIPCRLDSSAYERKAVRWICSRYRRNET